VGILVETLRYGQRDPLRSARVELAALGPAGVEAARRLIEAAWNDPGRFADIRNALDVLAYSEDPGAHDVIREVLDHEHPTPRLAAARALREHPRAADYERVRAMVDEESPDFRAELAQLMHELDPERAEAQFVAWIEDGQYPELWREVARNLAESPRERIQRMCCSLYEGKDDLPRAMLAAACARTGDPAALELLRGMQRGDRPILRQVATDALVAAQLLDELVWTLEREPDAGLRLKAVRAFAEDGGHLDVLVAGMSDADDAVAWACTTLLVQRGHAGALERALQELSSDRPGALQSALNALAPVMERDPAVARRAFERLSARDADSTARPFEERRPTLRALGLVPLEESAAWLHRLSLQVQGTTQGIPTARWIVLQIGNTGEAGQPYLIEALAGEEDPQRRLDLIEALAANPTELAREWLLERADAPDVPPYELLYLADRLVRMGPLERVAPVLKRATLRVEQADVRRALQGLLWTWYPGPGTSRR
jgi:HEAT repeat protein